VAVEVKKATFAATWRDEETGEILGYTLGDTMCRSPRRPWAMTGTDDEWQFPLPCGECDGCLERIRRALADRLNSKYGKPGRASKENTTSAAATYATAGVTYSASLWLIRIWYPKELQVELSAKLHRRRGLDLEPGFFRLGTSSFAVLARSKEATPLLLRRLGLRHRVEPIRLSRGRRAWRRLTSGILVARVVYGEEVKRWYARGLPGAERMRWDVVKKAMQKPWRRRTGARVRTGRKIILVPPVIWSMNGDRFKEYREAAASAVSPEEAEGNKRWLAELVAGVATHSKLEAPAQPALSREAVQRFYAGMASRKNQGATETSAAAPNPSTLLGGGLQSSRHLSSNEPPASDPIALETWLHSGAPPPKMGRERDYEDWLDECWSDGRTRRAITESRMLEEREKPVDDRQHKFKLELDAWVERMKGKIHGG
jgi:hypothetical protein